jgi:hypothetical protein
MKFWLIFNYLTAANKYFSWKFGPKLLRMGSSIHKGYHFTGVAAFCITYWEHAELSPISWKKVSNCVASLFITLQCFFFHCKTNP